MMRGTTKVMTMVWITRILLPRFPKIVGVFLFLLGILFSGLTNKGVYFNSTSGFVTAKPSVKERDCLVEALWFESAGEPEQGIRAIASVILNRKQSKAFPDSICKVVHQPKQFSYRDDLPVGEMKQIELQNSIDRKVHAVILAITNEVHKGTFKRVVPVGVKWYTKKNIKRKWMQSMKIVTVVGEHKFLESKS